jgi:hypothetical protein
MSGGNLEGKNFFAALFDFGFTSFVTLRFLKLIYGILVGLILLTGLVFFLALIFRGGASVILALVGVPIVTLFYLVIARVYTEMIALFFRIGENTSLIARSVGNPPSTPPHESGPYYGNPYTD